MIDQTKQLTFRLPEALIARVEDCVSRIQVQSGFNVTRADVVRMLLTHALDDAACDLQRLLNPRRAKKREPR